jgi:hypothetical protein
LEIRVCEEFVQTDVEVVLGKQLFRYVVVGFGKIGKKKFYEMKDVDFVDQ